MEANFEKSDFLSLKFSLPVSMNLHRSSNKIYSE